MKIPRPSMMRSAFPIVAGVILSLVGASLLLGFAGGPCSATAQVFVDPVGALLGRRPFVPIGSWHVGVFEGDVCGGYWPSPLQTWITLWFPLLFVLGLGAALASRLGTAPSLMRALTASSTSMTLLLWGSFASTMGGVRAALFPWGVVTVIVGVSFAWLVGYGAYRITARVV